MGPLAVAVEDHEDLGHVVDGIATDLTHHDDGFRIGLAEGTSHEVRPRSMDGGRQGAAAPDVVVRARRDG